MRFKVANYSRLEIRLDTLHIYIHISGNLNTGGLHSACFSVCETFGHAWISVQTNTFGAPFRVKSVKGCNRRKIGYKWAIITHQTKKRAQLLFGGWLGRLLDPADQSFWGRHSHRPNLVIYTMSQEKGAFLFLLELCQIFTNFNKFW